MTLYEIAEEYKALQEMADDPTVDPQTIVDTLEGVQGELKDKVNAYCVLIREATARKEARNAEIERLTLANTPDTNLIARLTRSLESTLKALEIPKIKTDLFSCAFKKNPDRAVWDDESKIPPQFWKYPNPVPQRAEIKAYLKECAAKGETCEWARLEGSERFEIK